MEYINGNPGCLHYTKNISKEIWGERGQLKVPRSAKLLEVFSDIAFGTGSHGRSLQGMAILGRRRASPLSRILRQKANWWLTAIRLMQEDQQRRCLQQ